MKGRPIKSGDGLRAEQRSGGRGGASMKGRPLRGGDVILTCQPGLNSWVRPR
jgi:hypothetical protein